MDVEETKTPANAEAKPAAKPRAPRKSAARKSKEQPAGAAESSAAPVAKAPRKQRTEKKASAPAAEKPAASATQETAPTAPRKQRSPKAKKTAPKSASAQQPAEHEQKPQVKNEAEQPTPAPQPAPAQQPAPKQPRTEQQEFRPHKHEQPAQPQPKQSEGVQEFELDTRDFPAPEPAPGFAAPETVGGNDGNNGGGKNRRKRRRNRNRNRDNDQNQQQQPQSTPAIDPDELVRRAWKIYLGEVTEEGLALMDDRIAAEASRRAFRVAELFLIEAARHRRPATAQQPQVEQESAPVEDEEES